MLPCPLRLPVRMNNPTFTHTDDRHANEQPHTPPLLARKRASLIVTHGSVDSAGATTAPPWKGSAGGAPPPLTFPPGSPNICPASTVAENGRCHKRPESCFVATTPMQQQQQLTESLCRPTASSGWADSSRRQHRHHHGWTAPNNTTQQSFEGMTSSNRNNTVSYVDNRGSGKLVRIPQPVQQLRSCDFEDDDDEDYQKLSDFSSIMADLNLRADSPINNAS